MRACRPWGTGGRGREARSPLEAVGKVGFEHEINSQWLLEPTIILPEGLGLFCHDVLLELLLLNSDFSIIVGVGVVILGVVILRHTDVFLMLRLLTAQTLLLGGGQVQARYFSNCTCVGGVLGIANEILLGVLLGFLCGDLVGPGV